jgi:3-deoxy-D-manno-octulosonate 8-phosphate phosphatase (KDO 8-P phosphatase)
MQTPTLQERCAGIELLLMDVDGVLTDGRIIYDDKGGEVKAFFVRDGLGLSLWRKMGKRAGVITGRSSPIVTRRAVELGFDVVVQGAADKRSAFLTVLDQQKLRAEQTAFVGDDVVDVPVLASCGLAVAVADACAEAVECSHYVTHAAGGRGAVRETIELLLKAQGLWDKVMAGFRA